MMDNAFYDTGSNLTMALPDLIQDLQPNEVMAPVDLNNIERSLEYAHMMRGHLDDKGLQTTQISSIILADTFEKFLEWNDELWKISDIVNTICVPFKLDFEVPDEIEGKTASKSMANSRM